MGAFIRQTPLAMSRPRAWAEHVRQWAARPDVHLVSMRALLTDPAAVLRGIGERFGLTVRGAGVRVPGPHRRGWAARLWRALSVRPPSTAVVTPTRPRPWRASLGPADRAFFHAEAGAC